MESEAVEFLIRAKKKTYAGKGAEVAASRPNSHDFIYKENGLKYIDSYLGGRLFTGEEAIWKNGVPIWAMNYSGRITGEKFRGDFLKTALLNMQKDMPYRGPAYLVDGFYIYCCKVAGTPEWFQGREEISYRGETVYECYFHGGAVE